MASTVGMGMIFALTNSEVFAERLESLSIIIIFVVFTATMINFQIPETFPTKEELEWRESIQYLLAVNTDGLVFYNQSMSRDSTISEGPNEVLIGGQW